MNRWWWAAGAFGLAVAVAIGLAASSAYRHAQAVFTAEIACLPHTSHAGLTRAQEQQFERCMERKGFWRKNPVVTTTKHIGTPQPAGVSFSTKFSVKTVTTRSSSGVTSRHT